MTKVATGNPNLTSLAGKMSNVKVNPAVLNDEGHCLRTYLLQGVPMEDDEQSNDSVKHKQHNFCRLFKMVLVTDVKKHEKIGTEALRSRIRPNS
jgi:hypothetical protein